MLKGKGQFGVVWNTEKHCQSIMHCMVQKINNSEATAAANCNAANVSVLQSHYPPENL